MTTANIMLTEAKNRFHGEEVKSIFETSKGSLYFVSENYATLRHKSLHIGHGAEDQGWKSISHCTVYVTEEVASHIAGPLGFTTWLLFREIGEDDLELHHVLLDYKTKTVKKSLGIIDFQVQPQVGLSPLELFDLIEVSPGVHKPSSVHPGNKITRLMDV